ncbi:two component system sensor histidine kinase, hybrid [Desulfobacula toluolica Tol2]|uniref:histidine kinase n=1 Tax=Desulfobacula toluolica (strain DSM 7467 / Tol2) TaxID=651182 RepID=K0NRJ1_DESTT|nr:two component system sensor histidine kinase, hybrid [Desulfobacula toluolica Tol2]
MDSKNPGTIYLSPSKTKNYPHKYKFISLVTTFNPWCFFALPVIPFLIFILINISFITAGNGQENLSVKVGVYENKPKIFTDSNGRVAGFWPDLLAYIANKENWDITYIHGTWNEGLERLLANNIDIMPDVAFTEERANLYAFSKSPVLISWSRLYIKKNVTDIKSIRDLENKTIAVLKGSVNFECTGGIKELLQKFNINCTFLEFDSYNNAFEAVKNDLADACVTNRNFGNKNEKKFQLKKTAIIFQPININFAFTKNASLPHNFSERIDHHMEQLFKDSTSFYYQLLEKYFETTIAKKTVEIFPDWIKTVLKSSGILLAFLVLVVFISRVQAKKQTAEIKIKNKALQKSEAHLRTLIETIPDLIWLKDPDGVYLACNPKFERFFGAKETDIVGKTDYDFVDKKMADFFRENDRMAMAAGKPTMNEEEIIFNDDGHKELLETVKTPMYDSDDKLIGVLGIGRDFTRRKQAEQEKIIAQKIAAEHKKLALVGQIAGKMAHDFNNILGIIMGHTDLSLMECKDLKTRKTLELILQQTLKGRNLTKNLVAFAKDQDPKQKFFELNAKLDLVLNLLNKDIEELELIKEYNPEMPELLADPGMIEHAFVNIIQNSIHALSMTENPKIIIRTYYSDNNIIVEIEDNGCGIPEEHIEKIYEPAFTLKGSRDLTGSYKKNIKGTGYGMANVKKYIEQHKGNISIESKSGTGTKVIINLPVIKKVLTKEEKTELQKAKLQFGKNILIVEDEAAISEVQHRILTQAPCHHTVDIASNGQTAIDLLKNNHYDLISLDYILPGNMNGIHIYNHIRETDKAVPILFISGNIDFLESIKEIKQKDVNIDHLSKPCQNKDYVDAINRLLENALPAQ